MSRDEDRQTIRMVGARRMQCKDIPDEVFLAAVRRAGEPGRWRMRWNVHELLEAEIGPVPENLFMAKARKLIARGLMDGCACGCRGDFELPEELAGNLVPKLMDPVVFVPCPGAPCVSYLYGIDHKHTERRPGGEQR